jgi:4-amino-4-deoxy-L-arabinose transferase-like glycosyltransferase
MPYSSAQPPISLRSTRRSWFGALLVFACAVFYFGYHLGHEANYFVDESAYLSQAFYANLWIKGQTHDPAWLDFPAFDLPPMPKYLIGLAVWAGGYRAPGPDAWRLWYLNTSTRFDQPGELTAARWPSVILGALGCVAVYALGTLAGDARVGGLAALFLMFNPLYGLHARRAMSDVPAEAFLLLALACALWSWQRFLEGRRGVGPWMAAIATGVLGGCSALCKLNGVLVVAVVGAWAIMALGIARIGWGRKLAVLLAALVTTMLVPLTFIALNPFLTAHPTRPLSPGAEPIASQSLAQRARLLIEHRVSVSQSQQGMFPHNALRTPWEKSAVVAVQGYGRFGPFGPRQRTDSERRFHWAQDWGAVIWLPCVLSGVCWAVIRGRRQEVRGEPPTAWAVLVQAVIALAAVTSYLPLAWDRYFLPLQSGSALLAAGAAVMAWDRIVLAASSRRAPRT